MPSRPLTDSCSWLRSPALASSMIFCATASGRGNEPVRVLEGHKGHLESDAQETGGLGAKPVALQVVPDRDRRYA